MGAEFNRVRNKRIIDDAFKTLQKDADRLIERGFLAILPECVMYALASHDEEHHLHTDYNDFYGWALLHNGKEVARWTNKPDKHGRVDEAVRSVPNETWVGIVIAGMRSYFSDDYEIMILNDTRDTFVKHYWKKYFTPIGLD